MTTLTFDQRLEIGLAHEDRVRDELTRLGWTVDPCGQGTLSPVGRRAIQRTKSLRRWEPDMMAARGPTIVAIDAKGTTSTGTSRHCIGRDSLRAALKWEAYFELPFYFVFSDLGVLTPHEVLSVVADAPHPIVDDLGGHVFFPTAHCRDFETVFGHGAWMFP